ncbi:MAG: DUF58 domain-containing protein [Actinomycetota bacterium]
MTRHPERHRFALTAAGAGVLILVVPGLLVAVAAGQLALVGAGVAALVLLVTDAFWARSALRGSEIRASGPTTTTVGSEFPLRLDCRARRPVTCVITVENAVRPAIPAALPVTGDVAVHATQRGVLDTVAVGLRSTGPIGLAASSRLLRVDLAAPVHVEPRRIPVQLPSMAVIDPLTHVYRGDDEPIGLRPYARGDSPRDVHWASVARTGTMVVRDRRRGVAGTELDVIIETFRADCDLAQLLGQARSALEQLLAAGYHIRLVTVEADPTSAPGDDGGGARYAIGLLSNLAELGVRLSRVVVGRPGHLAGAIGSSARLVIRPEGFQWQSSR